jgi:hypothetical protein
MATLSRNIGLAALEALGLPKEKCLSLTLEFEPDTIVVATVKYAPDLGPLESVVEMVRKLKPAD